MRQVSWPTRPEVINYTLIVFFVCLHDLTHLRTRYGFSKFVTFPLPERKATMSDIETPTTDHDTVRRRDPRDHDPR